jgi:ABC-type Mn2+/Zn2+ transport system permease subunit
MVAERSCDDRLLQFLGLRIKRGAVVADTLDEIACLLHGDSVLPREIADLVRLAARDAASVGLTGFVLSSAMILIPCYAACLTSPKRLIASSSGRSPSQ